MQSIPADDRLIFDANRGDGRVAFSVAAHRGITRRRTVGERGPLRVRFPNVESGALEAVIVNTAGGITGGDALAVEIDVGRGAQLVAGTTAAEKIYRSTGADASLSVALSVQAAGWLHWLPQETILFDRARLSRRIDIDVADGASLVMAESLVFGRAAMGESVTDGRVVDRWRVRHAGRLVFAENMRLEGAIAERLAHPAVAKGWHAVATLLIVPGDETVVTQVRESCAAFRGEAGISAWNGIAVARFCAPDGAALRHDIMTMLAALRVALPRLWLQ
ncbi:MAG: urease accessory protein UreD [Pseudolabrys sp.]|nr:urease accessory protein UreD [Pseudolabrys sp.]